MIPKKIHYCWFGKKNKSKLVNKCINSWKKYCPDYEIIEWNEDNFDISLNQYVLETYREKKWAFLTDFARLWIIYNHGGIYLDTDVELIKNLDSLLECEAYFGSEDNKTINTGIGFGAEKHNYLVKKMMDDYNNITFIKKDGNYDITTCVIRNSNSIQNIFLDKIIDKSVVNNINNIYYYPSSFFCPYDYNTGILNISKDTVSIHWCNASWQSGKMRIKSKTKKYLIKIIGEKNFDSIKKLLFKGRKNE